MQLSQYRQVRIEKLQKLQALGLDVWPRKAETTHGIVAIVRDHAQSTAEQLEAEPRVVSVMGRVTAIREMGKSIFAHITENGEKLQAYFRVNDLEAPGWEVVKLLDIGDFIAVTGPLMRTRMGELSVRAQRIQFLTKAYLPLPEKWAGLKDKEIRYRRRYLDLVANPDVIKTFQTRSRILAGVRRYMEGQGFLEVETPMMQPIPGGATARPFVTHHNALDIPLYLRIAPELYLKRLIVGGFDKVFEINRSFRNEGIDYRHNPEFTMMESYAAGQDLRDVMVMIENLFEEIATPVRCRGAPLGRGRGRPAAGHQLPGALPPPDPQGRHRPVRAPRARAPGRTPREVARLAREAHVEDVAKKPTGILLGALFEHYAEEHLVQPTFVTDYPVELSPLTQEPARRPGLRGPFRAVHRRHGTVQRPTRSSTTRTCSWSASRPSWPSARRATTRPCSWTRTSWTPWSTGSLPPAGVGVGIDRMVMLMTNSSSIRDVILFPLMRPVAQDGADLEQEED